MQRIIKSVILNNRTPDEIKEKVKSTTSSWRQLFTPIGTMAKMPPIKREYLVEDMLQLGLIVLGGPSTIGKSWFMLQVAHAVASGTMFMGREVKQGNVLYLSMEDTRDDVIKRYEMMGISREELDNLPMMFHTIEQDTIMPTLTKGYEEKVEEWIKDPDIVKPTLLIQDTYQLVYENTAGMDPYQNDVKNLKGIQKVIKSHGVTAIFSAHTTKAKHKKDQWSQLMGSVGKQSTSDQMILMTGDRSTRVNSPVDFSYRGRYGAGHIKLRMDQRCLWQEVDEKDANTGMTERDKKIIDIVKRKKECSPSDVSNEFGYKDSKDRQNIQKCMTKLVNNFHLHKVKSGVYSLSPF